ncbi:MAG: hypothetical protein IT384_24835 [Deltaproteobacteria bacterium]|nr:hypothetical protein [Deltaproteobacteria bacterium]
MSEPLRLNPEDLETADVWRQLWLGAAAVCARCGTALEIHRAEVLAVPGEPAPMT